MQYYEQEIFWMGWCKYQFRVGHQTETNNGINTHELAPNPRDLETWVRMWELQQNKIQNTKDFLLGMHYLFMGDVRLGKDVRLVQW